jgi:uncharacterized membrane protein
VISLEFFYLLVGLLFAAVAAMTLRDAAIRAASAPPCSGACTPLVYLAGERLPPAAWPAP